VERSRQTLEASPGAPRSDRSLNPSEEIGRFVGVSANDELTEAQILSACFQAVAASIWDRVAEIERLYTVEAALSSRPELSDRVDRLASGLRRCASDLLRIALETAQSGLSELPARLKLEVSGVLQSLRELQSEDRGLLLEATTQDLGTVD
jgi:hypothetical protein